MSERLVSVENRDGIAVLTIDHPPVNALSAALRTELHQALVDACNDDRVSGLVIGCAGRTFIAGADISELGTAKQRQEPILPNLCLAIETLGKPVVAAIQGSALGGGLELALACSHRVATATAKFGLPEVKLGVIPGAGGTVRLPRLIGPERAVEMIVSGAPVGAADALAIGLIDEIASSDVIGSAITFLQSNAAKSPAASDEERLAATRADPAEFERLAAKLAVKAKGATAQLAAIDAVRNAFTQPFETALQLERSKFVELSQSAEAKALRHLFFAEREAAKIPDIDPGIKPRTISRVGVVGAGTMGTGIAMACLNAGIPVTLLELNAEALERGMTMVTQTYAASVSRGSLLEGEKAARLARLSTSTEYNALADCDLVIEAVFEDMDVKKEVFAKLDRVAKPGTILATNTSYLDVNTIAAVTSQPQNVVGLHFFSPAHVMKLVEVVRAAKTAPDVLVTALALARRMGKVAVVVGVCHGFVGNRMMVVRGADAENLLLEGADPAQVDKAFTDFGWPMGPFQMGDLAGLDIGWRNRKATGKRAIIADTLCEMGHFGQKTGRGFYFYEAGSRAAKPDRDVIALIERVAAERRIVRRSIGDTEIVRRTLLPMIAEGHKILAEGIVARASDIDLIWVYGYGFPARKGGPMYWERELKSEDLPE